MKRQRFKVKSAFLAAILSVSCSGMAYADLTTRGTVTDGQGEPLIGVTVLQKNSKNGTVTDIDGKFQITVPDDAQLTFSYVGYVPQT